MLKRDKKILCLFTGRRQLHFLQTNAVAKRFDLFFYFTFFFHFCVPSNIFLFLGKENALILLNAFFQDRGKGLLSAVFKTMLQCKCK